MRNWKLALVVVVAVSCLGAPCGGGGNPISIAITSPSHGDFLAGANVQVVGQLLNVPSPELWGISVNNTPVTPQPDGSFSISLPLDTAAVFNPILAQAVAPRGQIFRHRIVVHAGASRADGALSEESVALRLDDQGLDSLETVVGDLVDLDIASLLPPGTVVISNYCAVPAVWPFSGCWGEVDVVVANPPPSFTGFGLDVDSMTDFAAGDVLLNNVRVDANINGSGLAPSCGLRLTASTVSIIGDYDLEPDAVDPTAIDVNLLGSPGVSFTAFNEQYTSGLCDFPLIGDLIQLIIGDIQPVVIDGLRDFLSDPDGGGPADAPIAEGIETALAGISIAGPIGQSLGAILDAPLFAVDEDDDGITLGSDSSFVADCTPPAGAPDLAASYHVDEAFPAFGPLTPGGSPFGMALSVSTSAFNQLLKAQTECGLLLSVLTELAFGGGPPQPITASLLSLFVPQFQVYPPNTPFRIELTPTLAPIVTGNAGPSGELAELKIAQLQLSIIVDATNEVVFAGPVDTRLGMELGFDEVSDALVFGLSAPLPGDVSVVVTTNKVLADVILLETFVLPNVIAFVLPSLASSLGEFPLPTFLDLEIQGVEVSAQGEFMSLFADLVPPAP